jgi:hypothetical protein
VTAIHEVAFAETHSRDARSSGAESDGRRADPAPGPDPGGNSRYESAGQWVGRVREGGGAADAQCRVLPTETGSVGTWTVRRTTIGAAFPQVRGVARGGVEPPTFRFSVGRSYQLSYLAVPAEPRSSRGDPDGTRTRDLRRDRAAR